MVTFVHYSTDYLVYSRKKAVLWNWSLSVYWYVSYIGHSKGECYGSAGVLLYVNNLVGVVPYHSFRRVFPDECITARDIFSTNKHWFLQKTPLAIADLCMHWCMVLNSQETTFTWDKKTSTTFVRSFPIIFCTIFYVVSALISSPPPM